MMSDTTLSRPEVVSGHTDVIYSTSVCHILAVRKSTLLPIDTIIRKRRLSTVWQILKFLRE
ncbi:putative restriction methylase [Escherichia coli]|nr:putative restriction methylase [Escherichia coli]